MTNPPPMSADHCEHGVPYVHETLYCRKCLETAMGNRPAGLTSGYLKSLDCNAGAICRKRPGCIHARLRRAEAERDSLAAKLAVAREALQQYASAKSKMHIDADGRHYYQGDGGHRARVALARIDGDGTEGKGREGKT